MVVRWPHSGDIRPGGKRGNRIPTFQLESGNVFSEMDLICAPYGSQIMHRWARMGPHMCLYLPQYVPKHVPNNDPIWDRTRSNLGPTRAQYGGPYWAHHVPILCPYLHPPWAHIGPVSHRSLHVKWRVCLHEQSVVAVPPRLRAIGVPRPQSPPSRHCALQPRSVGCPDIEALGLRLLASWSRPPGLALLVFPSCS
jgi:hypothetical protein